MQKGNLMRKLTVLLMLVFALAMAGGCAKKVASTPAGTTASGAGEGSAAAPSGVNDAQLKAIDKIGADRIYFAFDKSDLTEESRQILTEKSELLKSFPALSLLVEGHCDERGTEEYNLALGERRARAAYDFLLNLGIPASQMEMVSFGKLHPAVMGSGESAWSKNRRDDFKAYKPR